MAVVAVSGLCSWAHAASGSLADKVKRDWCAQLDDDPGLLIHEQRMREIRAAGERGRKALLSVARSKDGPWVCAVTHLVELQEPRVIPILRMIFSDPTRPTTDHLLALRLRGAMNDREAVAPALDSLRNAWATVEVALSTLGDIDDERARERLRKAARESRYVGFLTDIVRGLGAQRDPKAVDVLVSIRPELGRGERGEAILRREIALALVRIGTIESLGKVRDVLAPIRDEEVGPYSLREVLRVLDQEKAGKAPPDAGHFDEVIRQVKALQAKLESR